MCDYSSLTKSENIYFAISLKDLAIVLHCKLDFLLLLIPYHCYSICRDYFDRAIAPWFYRFYSLRTKKISQSAILSNIFFYGASMSVGAPVRTDTTEKSNSQNKCDPLLSHEHFVTVYLKRLNIKCCSFLCMSRRCGSVLSI